MHTFQYNLGSNTNIQKHREERSLMLRKEKLLENIMNKRLSSIGAKLIDRTGDTSIVDYSANNDGKDVMDDCGILDFDKNMEFYYTKSIFISSSLISLLMNTLIIITKSFYIFHLCSS